VEQFIVRKLDERGNGIHGDAGGEQEGKNASEYFGGVKRCHEDVEKCANLPNVLPFVLRNILYLGMAEKSSNIILSMERSFVYPFHGHKSSIFF